MTLTNPGRTRRRLMLLVLVASALVLISCAPGMNPARGVESPDGQVAGFWLGLWHGTITPLTFLISLFSDSIRIYEVHNSGNWYDFGFALGAGILWGGGAVSSYRKMKAPGHQGDPGPI